MSDARILDETMPLGHTSGWDQGLRLIVSPRHATPKRRNRHGNISTFLIQTPSVLTGDVA